MKSHVDLDLIIGKAHSRLVEVQIDTSQSAQTQIKILDQPDLRYARIVAIETFTVNDFITTQPSNYPTMTGAQMTMMSLVLETNDADDTAHWEEEPQTGKRTWIPAMQALGNGRFTSTQQNQKYLPLTALHRVQNSAGDSFVRDLQTFYNMYVSWDKCFLQVSNGGLGNGAVVGVPLMVYYSWLDINGKRIQRT